MNMVFHFFCFFSFALSLCLSLFLLHCALLLEHLKKYFDIYQTISLIHIYLEHKFPFHFPSFYISMMCFLPACLCMCVCVCACLYFFSLSVELKGTACYWTLTCSSCVYCMHFSVNEFQIHLFLGENKWIIRILFLLFFLNIFCWFSLSCSSYL